MDLEQATQRLTRRFGPDVEARCTALAFASGLDVDRLRAWCRAVAPIVAITRLRRPGSQQAVAELLALAR